MATAPGPPLGKSQPLAGVNSLTFAWQPPTSDGGSAITGYNIYVYGDPGYSGLAYSNGVGPTDRQVTVNGGPPWITNGITYYCQLTAVNAIGESAPFNFRPFQAGSKPEPPTTATASAVGTDKILVSWTPPSTSPDATIFWYVITVHNLSTDTITRRITANGISQSSYLVSDLPFGVYEFRVQSVNCPGYSTPTVTNTVTLSSGLELFLQGLSWTSKDGTVWPATDGPNAGLENGTAQDGGNLNTLYLDGSTDWLVPNLGSFGEFTINVWWKDAGTVIGGDSPCILTEIYTGGDINFCITTNQTPIMAPDFACGFFRLGQWYFGTPFTLPNLTWINIQYTYDGNTITTYINGSAIGTVSTGGVLSRSDGNSIRLGRRWDLAEYMFGFLGEVRIYSRALSAAEVLAAYNESLPNFP